MGYLSICTSACCLIIIGCFTAQTHCAGNITVTPDLFTNVYVTVPDVKVAKNLAGSLLLNELAATINIIPRVESYFWWNNAIRGDTELLLIIQTRIWRVNDVIFVVKNLHPFEICEIISTKFSDGNGVFFDYIMDNVKALVDRKKFTYLATPRPRRYVD